MSKLAIVIPAYKKVFFRETLDCFVNQTNKDFHLYVCDDHSPENLEEVIGPYRDKLPVTYHRFGSNIGSKHIVDQWERSIGMIGDEDWIWLFSDDDLVDEHAVEAFFRILMETKESRDIYSFNTCVINKLGDVMSEAPDVPAFETSEDMAYNLLLGKRANCMPDHIFRRSVYEKNGGFVKTLYGQGADWANSVLFSGEKGTCIISGAKVYWRYSGDNISSTASRHRSDMIVGHFQFLRWILRHFSPLSETAPDRYRRIRDAALQNLLSVIDYHYKGVPLSRLIYFGWFLKRYFNLPVTRVISLIMAMNTYRMGVVHKRKQNP